MSSCVPYGMAHPLTAPYVNAPVWPHGRDALPRVRLSISCFYSVHIGMPLSETRPPTSACQRQTHIRSPPFFSKPLGCPCLVNDKSAANDQSVTSHSETHDLSVTRLS